ncbi:MAG: hypothetical protein KatS3mg102_0708 [Planctomycetota bacterium]|nr:MAG: hypothetical protein KatS3mg102_0708 [Planctomycetota bacterium]
MTEPGVQGWPLEEDLVLEQSLDEAVQAVVAVGREAGDAKLRVGAIARLQVLCAWLGYMHGQCLLEAEDWEVRHGVRSVRGGPAHDERFLRVRWVEELVLRRIAPLEFEDALVRDLLVQALEGLEADGAVELWRGGEEGALEFRATARCVAEARRPLETREARGGGEPAAGGARGEAGGSRGEAGGGLNARERAVLALLRSHAGQFVPPPVIERTHGTRTRAPEIIRRIRQKRPDLRIESATEARLGREDATAEDAIGYRLWCDPGEGE